MARKKINYLEEPFYSVLKNLDVSNKEAAKKLQLDYNTILKYRREILSEEERKLVKRGSRKIKFDKEQLSLIADERVSSYQVANILGCDNNVIKDRRKRLYPDKDFSQPLTGNFAKDYLSQNYKKLMNKSLNEKLLNSIKFMDNISLSDDELKLLGDENVTDYRVSKFLKFNQSSVKRMRKKLYPDKDFSKKINPIFGSNVVFYSYIKDNYNKLWENYYDELKAKQLNTDKANEEKADKSNEVDDSSKEILLKDEKGNSVTLYNANDLEAKQLNTDKANEEKADKSNEEITINIDKKYLNQNAKILISQENDQLKIEIK